MLLYIDEMMAKPNIGSCITVMLMYSISPIDTFMGNLIGTQNNELFKKPRGKKGFASKKIPKISS